MGLPYIHGVSLDFSSMICLSPAAVITTSESMNGIMTNWPQEEVQFTIWAVV
jgi:hypothetical protein